MYPNPSYVDGLQAVVALSAYCYNNAKTYMCYSGDPSEGAAQTELKNSDNQTIGSVTYADARKGSTVLAYELATDEIPGATNLVRPDYIISFRGRYFVVGEVKTPIVKNDVIKFTCNLIELQNPFIPNLLSVLGQQLRRASATGATQSCAGSNTRTGATVAYSIETFATPGTAAPSGITISSSTGLVTLSPVAGAGTYDLRIIVSDTITLANGDTSVVYGWGRLTSIIS